MKTRKSQPEVKNAGVRRDNSQLEKGDHVPKDSKTNKETSNAGYGIF